VLGSEPCSGRPGRAFPVAGDIGPLPTSSGPGMPWYAEHEVALGPGAPGRRPDREEQASSPATVP
jgi:hypothetical protein